MAKDGVELVIPGQGGCHILITVAKVPLMEHEVGVFTQDQLKNRRGIGADASIADESNPDDTRRVDRIFAGSLSADSGPTRDAGRNRCEPKNNGKSFCHDLQKFKNGANADPGRCRPKPQFLPGCRS